jgi:hypothetical protein
MRMEREVAMLVDTTYDEWIRSARNEGRVEGLRAALRRAWQRRFGDPAPAIDARIERLSAPETLESALETVVAARDVREAETGILSAP